MSTPDSSWLARNGEALLESITLFTLLIVTLSGVAWYFDFSSVPTERMRWLAFAFAFFTCVLISKNTYDIRRLTAMPTTSKPVTSDTKTLLSVANQHLFQQVYHNSPVPYVLIEQAGTITSANVAAFRLFQSTQEKLVGTDIFSVLRSSKVSHLQFMQQKFQTGIAISNEEIMIDVGPEESPAWALFSLYPFTDSFQQPVGLVTLVDITRQKQIENAKAEFVSLASHQLRTPIAGMRWSAELLLMDNPSVLSHRQRKYIDRMLESVNRMNLLVDDFLRVSRFELGTFTPEAVTVSLPTLIAEIQTDQAAIIRKKNISVVLSLDAQLGQLLADPNLLRMIATNLISNAVKYTPEGGTVSITGTVQSDEFTFEVRDTGMGIPLEDQSQIFQKLFRASNATREVPDGTGLGLYIVHQAVRVMRGRISFVSAPGVGTTFTVVLPYEG